MLRYISKILTVFLLMLLSPAGMRAGTNDAVIVLNTVDITEVQIDTSFMAEIRPALRKGVPPSIYSLPYSLTTNVPQWHRLWINTAVLSGAFVGTLLVLECLPEDATTWNRAALQKDPPYKRWFDFVFRKGPEWDHDKFVFNYVLHPYAGAAYFMAARSCGFNFWRSFLYSAIISNIGWEFGIEACMERPSYQDLVITPVVGSLIGEMFYRLKRGIVRNGYTLGGSPVLGNVGAFLIDPVNEVVNLFRGSDTRGLYKRDGRPAIESVFVPKVGRGSFGFTLSCTF